MEVMISRMKSNDNKDIGKKMILSAIKMEESLSRVIKVETQLIRRQLHEGNSKEELVDINKTIKNVIMSLMILDERIKTGLHLLDK